MIKKLKIFKMILNILKGKTKTKKKGMNEEVIKMKKILFNKL